MLDVHICDSFRMSQPPLATNVQSTTPLLSGRKQGHFICSDDTVDSILCFVLGLFTCCIPVGFQIVLYSDSDSTTARALSVIGSVVLVALLGFVTVLFLAWIGGWMAMDFIAQFLRID